jgi:hypothetical protein
VLSRGEECSWLAVIGVTEGRKARKLGSDCGSPFGKETHAADESSSTATALSGGDHE